ncbi:MAG: amylo-alpha-1,6-glucosidase [Trebonia sp.]
MSPSPPGPRFDLWKVPFSHYGSWLSVSPVTGNARYSEDLHLVSHRQGMHAVLSLRPITPDGDPSAAPAEAIPSQLSWVTARGRIDLTYEDAETLRIRGAGLGLRVASAAQRLTPFSGTYFYRDPVDASYVYTSYETGRRYRVTVLSGEAVVAGDQALGSAVRSIAIGPTAGSSSWEIAIEEYGAGRLPYHPGGDFETARASAAAAFAAFSDRVAPWRSELTPAAEQAAYLLWSATVAPAGFLTRPAVLMSKHWMNKVWSWDHCFNALALAEGHPALAWDQFALPFDHQDPAGGLPDSVTHSEVLYNFVKPPVHGWALAQLRQRLADGVPPEDLSEVYRRLEQWTEYWLSRRAPGSPLPHYHHGNDSGWDNATTFDGGRVLESADLAALLALQMRELGYLGARVGRPKAGARWQEESRRMLAAMVDLLWTGERFAARVVGTGELRVSESLLDTIPIIAGDSLPAQVRTALATGVRRHLGPHGLATQPPGSPGYAADGYWRGPIWAPSTILIEDGLRRSGDAELADEVSKRFRTLCETSGFAENFDAVSGTGLRDRAYTWTASAYLTLAAAAVRRDHPAYGKVLSHVTASSMPRSPDSDLDTTESATSRCVSCSASRHPQLGDHLIDGQQRGFRGWGRSVRGGGGRAGAVPVPGVPAAAWQARVES